MGCVMALNLKLVINNLVVNLFLLISFHKEIPFHKEIENGVCSGVENSVTIFGQKMLQK